MNRLLVAAVVLLVALGTLLGSSGTSSADSPVGKIYYVSAGAILRSNLDGSGVEEIVSAGHSPGDMAVDKVGSFLYWTNTPAGTIQRADLNGSGITEIVSGIAELRNLTLDGTGKVYWTADEAIWRAEVDGSNVEAVLTPLTASGIAVDSGQGYIYWGTPLFGDVFRSDLDGGSVELWAQRSGGVLLLDLALDPSTGALYDVDYSPAIFQNPEFGTAGETGGWVVFGIRPGKAALDLEHGHMYWTDVGQGEQMFRADLDGSDVRSILGAGCCDGGVALGPCPPGDTCPPPPTGPAPTPTPTPTPTPNPVGGVALGQSLAPLRDDSEPARTLWLTMLGAIAVALSGSAWYAHKRWTRR